MHVMLTTSIERVLLSPAFGVRIITDETRESRKGLILLRTSLSNSTWVSVQHRSTVKGFVGANQNR